MDCICQICSRDYVYIRGQGHQKDICNTCRTARDRRNKKKKALERKGGKCQKCGYDKCESALQFHHSNPEEKDATVSSMIARNKSWKEIKKEVDKCILVCANCHCEIHEMETTRKKMQEYDSSPKEKKEFEHGTKVGYSYHKCRCDLCKSYNTENHRKYREKKKQNMSR
jgi:hypothetical protein